MANRDSYMGFARETTYGTFVSPTRSFEGESDSAKRANQYLERRGLRAARQTRRVDEVRTIERGASGSAPFTIMRTGFGMLFRAMLDTAAITTPGGATNARLHTFESAQEFNSESLTMQSIRGKPTGTNCFTYPGTTVAGWEISQSVDDYLKLSLDLDHRREIDSEAAHTATYPADQDEYAWADLAVTVDGNAVELRDFKVSAARGLDVAKYRLAASALKRQPRRVSDAEYSAEFTLDYESEAMWDLFVSGATVPIVATWTLGEVESGQAFFLKITMAAAQLRGETPTAELDGSENTQPVSVMALQDDTNPAIKIEYQTGDTAY
jgi:hypothetical protein